MTKAELTRLVGATKLDGTPLIPGLRQPCQRCYVGARECESHRYRGWKPQQGAEAYWVLAVWLAHEQYNETPPAAICRAIASSTIVSLAVKLVDVLITSGKAELMEEADA